MLLLLPPLRQQWALCSVLRAGAIPPVAGMCRLRWLHVVHLALGFADHDRHAGLRPTCCPCYSCLQRPARARPLAQGQINEDLDFLRTQIITSEVCIARLFNHDVKERRKLREGGGPSGASEKK